MNKDDCPTSSTFFFVKMSNAKATEMFPTFFQLEVILSADSPGISPLDCWLSEMAERSCAWKNEKGGACRHGQFVPFGWLLCQVANPKNQATYCIYIYIHTVYSNVYIIYIYIDTPVWIWGQQVFFWRVVQIAKTVGQKILPQSMWQMSHFLRCFVYSNCCGISEPSIILHSPRSHVWMQSRRTYSSLYFENFLNGVRLG